MPTPIHPPKRVYRDRERRGDGADAQTRYASFGAGIVGFGFGGLVGVRAGIGFPVGSVIGTLVAIAIVRGAMAAAARVFAGPLNPSGSSTAYKTDHSAAQSLLVQGKYREAAEAYEAAALESDGDPEPYFQLARIHRDHLGDYEAALEWLRRARTDAKLSTGQELTATQEIVALYTNKLGTPRKALPELVALTERFPGTPAAQTAQRELAEMRALLEREREGGGDFTAEFLRSRRRDAPEP